ncbi:hypothetical protein GQ43DRAFT_472195 [Delitschia confertaspora ATCC 74209]|uniref:Uncharacterized protein n=1 Tax=Delitschia confertaspora ATCC 74209 TaxID=1513339 RepID=A0A9P4JKS5_9PLEO|nr:hypothetical protein GQ43DRAFT_472195 [Delitschia confertaspora ATCC 74209]
MKMEVEEVMTLSPPAAFNGCFLPPLDALLGLLTSTSPTSLEQPPTPTTHYQPPPPAANSSSLNIRSSKIMSGQAGWRKRLQAVRPRTPVSQKPEKSQQSIIDEAAEHRSIFALGGADVPTWRKTFQGSRPVTPSEPSSSVQEYAADDDSRSEKGTEAPTPRRKSGPKPKLGRLRSSYLALTALNKSTEAFPNFNSDPWSFDFKPPAYEPIDPVVALESAYSHLAQFPGNSLPVQHNSGILRVFEDYRNIREIKGRLEEELQEVSDSLQKANEKLETTKAGYDAEIRGLEKIIAEGEAGLAAVIKARQGSIIKRRPSRLKKGLEGRGYQKRPSSPTARMVALSKQLSLTSGHNKLLTTITSGRPPSRDRGLTLASKVKSEIDLSEMIADDQIRGAVPCSVASTFSGSGDPLPDEMESLANTVRGPALGQDAFPALRDLSVRVARQRGIAIDEFFPKLMELLLGEEKTRLESDNAEDILPSLKPHKSSYGPAMRPSLRQARSHPYLKSGETGRRHFSFEPGDDQIAFLQESLDMYQTIRTNSPPSQRPTSRSGAGTPMSGPKSEKSITTLAAEERKRSRIPSPVHSVGARARRETSMSSLQSACRKQDNYRSDSRSSVLTAFHQGSGPGKQRDSKSSVLTAFRQTYTGDEQLLRNDGAALAAARAAENAQRGRSGTHSSETRNKKTTSASSPNLRTQPPTRVENEAPSKRS